MSTFLPEVQGQAQAFSSLLIRSVREYFREDENRQKFETWYEQRYGKKYVWKKVTT